VPLWGLGLRLLTLSDGLLRAGLAVRASQRPLGSQRRALVVLDERLLDARRGIWLIRFPALSYTLWRSVEVSRWRMLRPWLRAPLLDFGCGDGTIGALIFPQVAVGLDLDARALAMARRKPCYQALVLADGQTGLPFPDAVFAGVFCNSVLEHLPDLDAALREIARVLVPGGLLAASVPGARAETYLAGIAGPGAARAFARWQAHWHQYEGDWWIRTLAAYGLTVDHLEPYLSREAFLWFRLFAAPTFRLLERVAGPVLWRSWAPLLERLIVESVQPAEGACWLFLARKKINKRGCEKSHIDRVA